MTLKDYTKIINYQGELHRVMEFDGEQDYQVGGVYKLGVHWSTPSAESQYFLDGKRFTYNFYWENGRGYKIDYENLDEEQCSIFDTTSDNELESEVLVDSDILFKVVKIDGGFYDDDEQIYIADAVVKEI